jgi:RNA polymerase sigma-70 factor (ECF subfamily)
MQSPESTQYRDFKREAILHADLLYNYSLRMTNNAADAEQRVRETYQKAFRSWGKQQQGTNIRAWLFKILKNSFMKGYTRQSAGPDADAIVECTPRQTRTVDLADAESSVSGNLTNGEIAATLAVLPPEVRTVVILCDSEGLRYEDVAQLLDCPVDTVRARLQRGRMLLHQALLSYVRKREAPPGEL